MEQVNDLFRSQRVSASGLKATRSWMNILANNIANADSVDTGVKAPDGNYIPYTRHVPVFSKVMSEKFRENKVNGDVLNGVQVEEIVDVNKSVKKIWDPEHPAARLPGTPDAGYVYYPGVSTSQEMADVKVAAMSYEANLTTLQVANKMIQQALEIGKG